MSNVPNVNPTVATFISSLKQQFPDLSWPTYLFHYTDVLNAVGILEKGILFSRSAANLSGVLEVDCAGSEVISQTNSRVFDFVRLYFRPSTPPLWHVQGFIPRQEVRRSGVNPCPVPVFLLFDSVRVLSLPGVEFSDANLASPQANIYADPADLGKLDFDQIYHNRAIANDDPHKDWIVKRRCSEVIVPNRLELEPNLRYVVARSSAERELLLNLLDSSTRARLANKVIANGTCCTRRRQYVGLAE